MSTKPTLLDVMLNGQFVCQLRYDKHGFPVMKDDGKIIECFDESDLRKFVEERRPSLTGKPFTIIPATQPVFNR
jgi:hypothetical protein